MKSILCIGALLFGIVTIPLHSAEATGPIVVQRDARFQIIVVPLVKDGPAVVIKVDTETGQTWRLANTTTPGVPYTWVEIPSISLKDLSTQGNPAK